MPAMQLTATIESSAFVDNEFIIESNVKPALYATINNTPMK